MTYFFIVSQRISVPLMITVLNSVFLNFLHDGYVPRLTTTRVTVAMVTGHPLGIHTSQSEDDYQGTVVQYSEPDLLHMFTLHDEFMISLLSVSGSFPLDWLALLPRRAGVSAAWLHSPVWMNCGFGLPTYHEFPALAWLPPAKASLVLVLRFN